VTQFSRVRQRIYSFFPHTDDASGVKGVGSLPKMNSQKTTCYRGVFSLASFLMTGLQSR
jgi:hypothetical protein